MKDSLEVLIDLFFLGHDYRTPIGECETIPSSSATEVPGSLPALPWVGAERRMFHNQKLSL